MLVLALVTAVVLTLVTALVLALVTALVLALLTAVVLALATAVLLFAKALARASAARLPGTFRVSSVVFRANHKRIWDGSGSISGFSNEVPGKARKREQEQE